MNRKLENLCPAERWEHDARQWQAVAKRLAKIAPMQCEKGGIQDD